MPKEINDQPNTNDFKPERNTPNGSPLASKDFSDAFPAVPAKDPLANVVYKARTNDTPKDAYDKKVQDSSEIYSMGVTPDLYRKRRDTEAILKNQLEAPDAEVVIADDCVMVYPDSGTEFFASVDDERDVQFRIRTRDEHGTRDPYFEVRRAHEIAASTLNHFEENGGVYGVSFSWSPPSADMDPQRSDNFAAYHKFLNANNILEPTDKERIQAAKTTWTFNMIAKPNGFTEVADIEVNAITGSISGLFIRPKSSTERDGEGSDSTDN